MPQLSLNLGPGSSSSTDLLGIICTVRERGRRVGSICLSYAQRFQSFDVYEDDGNAQRKDRMRLKRGRSAAP